VTASPEPSQLARLATIVAELPETERVDVESWDGEPTFRVRGKVFVFAAPDGTSVGVKLPREEAEALVASDEAVTPMGYGLGRHGWVNARLTAGVDEDRWQLVTEWVRTSYALVAPKKLARLVEP
jgi:predicted DNA-binding protein (MmcQ/YjbR family)